MEVFVKYSKLKKSNYCQCHTKTIFFEKITPNSFRAIHDQTVFINIFGQKLCFTQECCESPKRYDAIIWVRVRVNKG